MILALSYFHENLQPIHCDAIGMAKGIYPQHVFLVKGIPLTGKRCYESDTWIF